MRGLWRAAWSVGLSVCVMLTAGSTGCTPAAAAPPATVRRHTAQIVVDDTVTLAGVLEIPVTASGAVPAVLMLSGSGPQDRDGARDELPGYRPFREIADTLLSAGIAVLRLDDRGTGASTGAFVGATTLDFAADARAAVHWMRSQPALDANRVAVLGHSEGALVALLAARADSAIWRVVMLGAQGRSGREVARWQRAALVSADQTTWPSSERATVLAAAESSAESAAASDPWLRTWFALDPRTIAPAVAQPVLLVHGDNDRQIPVQQAEELAAVFRASRPRAADTSVRLVRLPATNHLFLEDYDGDPRGYVRLSDVHVRPELLHHVAEWLRSPP